MKNRTYLRASFREISQSKGRFIAIILIIFLGTFLYVGVKATGPILNHSASDYVQKQNLSHLQIVSTGGLTEDDLAAAKMAGVNVETGKQFYYVTDKSDAAQIFSYNPNQKQNQLRVTEGKLPKTGDEIVLDSLAKDYGYHINDSYQIDDPDLLSKKDYKIVGFVDSPYFISSADRGYANVGSGTVNYFVYVPEENFTQKINTILYLSFENAQNLETYDQDYQKIMDQNEDKLETAFADRPAERLAEIKKEAEAELAPAKEEVVAGLTKIADTQAQLTAGSEQLQQQKKALEQLPEPQRSTGLQQLVESEAQLTQQQAQLDKQKENLQQAQQTLDENEQKITNMKEPTYLFHQRKDNPGFQEYGSLSERIAAIANVFPVFFFFIAALITFTTMTRMVEENRREVGTLKALGYTKWEISKKYILYAILSSSVGILLGSVLGIELLPRMIYFLSSDRYVLGKIQIFYVWTPIIQAAAAFVVATLGSALLVLAQELREKPAQLLQARAPKPGKRIFLEYITPLWSRLSFNQKISYRNIFRYKARMIMAIIGISGCAGLMVAGVGLKDSLNAVTNKQFGPITDYQAVVTIADPTVAKESQLMTLLKNEKEVKQAIPIISETVELRKSGQGNHSLTLMVPDSTKTFSDYIHLKNQDDDFLDLNDGAILTQKAAELFDVKKGDSLTFYTDNQEKITVKIGGIAQNYLGNGLYLSADMYKKATDTSFQANSFLLKTTAMSKKQEDALAKHLLATGDIQNTTFLSTQIDMQESAMGNLNSIVIILVVLSGALAFVVLYNLTNINVSERIRELSTIKVLGFYDQEVTMYIVRENIIFTLLGILAGYGIGYLLTAFILHQASMENTIFPLVINWQAYVLSGGMTILFTVIVMFVTHFKLKHVNMIDALKSNE